MVTAMTVRHWQALLDATGTAKAMRALEDRLGVDLRDEGARYAARDEISETLEPWFRTRSLADVGSALDAAGVCWGPYRTFAEALAEDPRASTESPLFENIEQPGIGSHRAAGGVIDFGALSRVPVRPAPVLGQHTDAVLSDVLGLSAARIGELHDVGIVAGPLR